MSDKPVLWLSANSIGGVEAFSVAFWKQHRDSIAKGEFWADRIRDLKDQPVDRLRFAVENFPLPSAFRQAAIAVRALIRAKVKAGSPHTNDLACLYWLAAINSFSMAYAPRLKEPGFNVLETIPGQVVVGLPFSYQTLGYEQLALLGRTDRKWLEAEWGPPKSHTTLLAMHRHVWDEYERLLLERRKREMSLELP